MKIRELSATGGGAAPGTGATANVGDGEGMAGKYAFGGAGGTKAKRKKGLVVKKSLDEKIEQAITDFCSDDIKEAENPYLNPNTKIGRPRDSYGKSVKDMPADSKRGSQFKDDNTSKSSFEEGKVHKIEFLSTPTAKDITKQKIVIYRKITKNEYDKLKANYKISAMITPSEEVNHFEDVYYVIVPKVVYGKRELGSNSEEYKYYTSFKLSNAKSLEGQLKDAIKFRYVPIQDIAEKGLTPRYLESSKLKDLTFKKEREPRDFKKQEPDTLKAKADKTQVKTTYAPGVKNKNDKSIPTSAIDYKNPKVLAKIVLKKNPSLFKTPEANLNKKAEDLAMKTLSKSGMSKIDLTKLISDQDFGIKYIQSIHDIIKSVNINEETAVVQQLPAGSDPLSKAKKAVTLLVNRFFGMTFEECVDNPELLKKLNSDAENVVTWIGKEEDKVFDSNEKMADALSNESSTIVAMQNVLSDLMSAFEDAHTSSFNINYKR
jgi:hypothetical protein